MLIRNQIKHETSAPYSPDQNRTVERGWRSLFEMARCMLLEARLAKELWAYAVMASAYIRNRCYNPRTGPEGRTVVGGRWVNAVKLGPNGEEKYKARSVAKGYSQIPNVDYHETFSPTARITSVRMLMQLTVQDNLA